MEAWNILVYNETKTLIALGQEPIRGDAMTIEALMQHARDIVLPKVTTKIANGRGFKIGVSSNMGVRAMHYQSSATRWDRGEKMTMSSIKKTDERARSKDRREASGDVGWYGLDTKLSPTEDVLDVFPGKD